MKSKMKLIPVIIMLIAGAITAICTWFFNYESNTALVILSGVLIAFYILGIVLRRILLKFEDEIENERIRIAEEEGKVVEKQGDTENTRKQPDTDRGVE